MRAAKASRGEWAKRIERWQESGESAEVFAPKLGCSSSSLQKWRKRLGASPRARFLQLVPKQAAVVASKAASELVVEVGATKVRVCEGFDARLLAQVVSALSGGAP